MNCRSVTVGDPETFVAIIDERFKNRVVITPQVELLGAKSNVTVDCEQDVRVVLAVTITEASAAAQIVEFEFSKDDLALVRSAIDNERKRCAAQEEAKLAEMRIAVEQEVTERFMRSLLRRFSAAEDVEHGREKFVIVKAFREIVMGGRGFLVFQVQNRTSNDFVVKEVEVANEKTSQPVDNVLLVMPERRVAPDAVSIAVVAFDAPEDSGTFVLSVREDGPRTIRVDDIDF